MNRYKVLWCDRNIRSLDLLDIFKYKKELEIDGFDNIEDALNHFKNNRDYSLVISGNSFSNNKSGLDFFKSLNISGLNPQFLLLAGGLKLDSYSFNLMKNFTYIFKDSLTPEQFEELIEDLLAKSLSTQDLDLKLKILRLHFKYTEIEFALMLGTNLEKVKAYESGKIVPSSYIVSVANKFKLPLSYFSSLPLDIFSKRIEALSSFISSKESV